MTKNKWESNSKHSTKAPIPLDKSEYKDEDELKQTKLSELAKLLYVAMTRAKHTLRMSFPQTVDKKPRELTNFLVDIQEFFEHEKEPFEYDNASYWDEIKKLLVKRKYDYIKEFGDFIDLKLNNAKFSFSVSNINKYLSCPRQYLYDRILKLDTKDGNPNALTYGTAIHFALERALFYIKEKDTLISKSQFIEFFKDKLSKLPMENYKQREIFEKRGTDALYKYYCMITKLKK